MKAGSLVVAALLMSTCAEKLPSTPSGPNGPTPGVPSRLELSANPGQGSEAGTGTITARVFDGLSTALASQTVTFTASAGTLSASQVVSDDKGYARTSINADPGSVQIVAAVGSVEQKALMAIQEQPLAPLPGDNPTTTTTTTTTTVPTTTSIPVASYSVTLEASPSGIPKGGGTTLTATATALNGAPSAPAKFAWDCSGRGQVDGETTTPTNPCGPFPTVGTFTPSVTASNGAASGSATTTITVALPVIALSCDSPKIAMPMVTCVVAPTVAGSPLPSTSVTTATFDWGDSQSSTITGTNVATHTYTMAAVQYPVIATATVSGVPGVTATASVTLVP